nr:hypothetical protein HAU86_22935 [Bradyrhizobium symbiodeficiens]
MDFHFIDFGPRRSEYGSNHCRRLTETKMSFRLSLILATVLAADKDRPWVKILVDSYHSPEAKEFVLATFKGAVLPSW